MSKHDHEQLKLAMILKAHALSSENDNHIRVDDVFNALQHKWQSARPLRFHQMIFDVFDLTLQEVVQHTILNTMKQSLKAPLSAYENLFGGSNETT